VDSLKALDPRRPIREADIEVYLNLDQFVPFAGATSILFVMDESKFFTKPRHH
jgi:hypothetical protein